ncbi:MAG: xcpT 2 [Pedosphaera sp.]|nr:xcpT 2 [Pedosphaera sp.]
MRTSRFQQNSQSAFTFIELLSIIAVIALLSFLILPALAHAGTKSPAAGCINNMRQLMIGWSMYKEDNNDFLMPNAPAGTSGAAWINPLGVEGWSYILSNTNLAYLTGGLMGPYVAKDFRLFKCPADIVPSANGQRVRSYSMNGQMAGGTAAAGFNPGALVYNKGSDLTCPAPANAFVFCDEHPGSINDGMLQVNSQTPIFPDVPASYLDGACGFGFADGHAEIHKWKTPSLLIQVTPGYTVYNIALGGNNVDWLWFTQHAACNHR